MGSCRLNMSNLQESEVGESDLVTIAEKIARKYAQPFMKSRNSPATEKTNRLDEAVKVAMRDFETKLITMLPEESAIEDSLLYPEASWEGLTEESLHRDLALSIRYAAVRTSKSGRKLDLSPWGVRGSGVGTHYDARWENETKDAYEDKSEDAVLLILMLGVLAANLDACAWAEGDLSHLDNNLGLYKIFPLFKSASHAHNEARRSNGLCPEELVLDLSLLDMGANKDVRLSKETLFVKGGTNITNKIRTNLAQRAAEMGQPIRAQDSLFLSVSVSFQLSLLSNICRDLTLDADSGLVSKFAIALIFKFS